jgi:type IV pilus assembly protein PilY1
MVDVETGKVIYKRVLQGATPGEPAVVDSNSDGLLDKVYVATTAGLVYKVDLSTPMELRSYTVTKTQALPNLAADTVVQRVIDPLWDPFPIFDTIDRPIYYAPTALFISKLNTVALAFGTGDRENLWDSTATQEGRFYLIVDDGFTAAQAASGVLPRDESMYQAILPNALKTSQDYVLSPSAGKARGWFLRLGAGERVITPAFGLVGFLTFSSYEPQVTVSGGSGGPVCGRTGLSRVYVVFSSNANGVLKGPTAGSTQRFSEVPVFLAPPTIDSGPTQNRPRSEGGPGGGSGGATDPDGDGREDTLSLDQREIMEELKKYFPPDTRFGNYWYDVSAMGSDTRYVGIAAIPIGILQKNWKEN